MNRRDFIGAAIGALVAALLLPFEEFAAWCRRWLGEPDQFGTLWHGVNRVFFFGPPAPTRILFSRIVRGFDQTWLEVSA